MLTGQVIATNGWDVLVFGIPSTIAAVGTIFAAFWARDARGQARHAKEQVSSPNGVTTGDAVDQIRRDLVDLRANQAEFKESVRASRILTAQVRQEIRDTREGISEQISQLHNEQVQHAQDDNDRFEVLFDAVNGKDEA